MIVCVGGSEVRVRGSAEGSTGETIRMRPRLRPEATETTLTGTAKQMYRRRRGFSQSYPTAKNLHGDFRRNPVPRARMQVMRTSIDLVLVCRHTHVEVHIRSA